MSNGFMLNTEVYAWVSKSVIYVYYISIRTYLKQIKCKPWASFLGIVFHFNDLSMIDCHRN